MNALHFFLPLVLLTATFNCFSQVGSLDPEFSGDGFVRSSIGLAGSSGRSGVLQPDGKILFGGPCWGANSDNDFGLGRLLPNGDFDSTFSGDGRMSFDLGSYIDWLTTVVVRLDGKITTFGRSQIFNPYSHVFALAQFNPDGTVDSSFGTNGVVKSRLTGSDGPSKMEIQADGKIVTAGTAQIGLINIIVLARYLTNGQFDTTFNNNGIIYDEIPNVSASASDIDIQADGKIIAAGYIQTGIDFDYVMRRYHLNGVLDTTFGVAGLVSGDLTDQINSELYELTILPNGKLLVAGQVSYPRQTILARFNADGSLDTSFGIDGVSIILLPGHYLYLKSILPLSDGRILISGEIVKDDYTGRNLFVARMLENGVFDQSFGIDGLLQISILPDGTNNIEAANEILVQPDGKIILVGTSGLQSAIFRLLTELHVGLLDFTAETVAPLIYPNPIVETATLQYELSEATAITVELYDLQGKRMLTLLPETEQAEGQHEVPILLPSHLASGAYVLSVSNAKGRVAVQVIKQ
jgi:uncharacterized delta-60 repeat protein